MISACETLPHQLTLAKARELGAFLYERLILQLRSIGPGLVVDLGLKARQLIGTMGNGIGLHRGLIAESQLITNRYCILTDELVLKSE